MYKATNNRTNYRVRALSQMGDCEDEGPGDPKLSYAFNPKVFPWDLRDSWTDRDRMAKRRAFIEEILKANDWDTKEYRAQAYTEASQMITSFSRMHPERIKALQAQGCVEKEKRLKLESARLKEDLNKVERDLGVRRPPVTCPQLAMPRV